MISNWALQIICSQKLIRSLPDIAEQMYKNIKRSNFFQKPILVSCHVIIMKLILWELKYHETDSRVLCNILVKYKLAIAQRFLLLR